MKNFKNGGKFHMIMDYSYTCSKPKVEYSIELFQFLSKVANESHLQIYGVTTGLNDGIDFRFSNNFRNYHYPK